MADQDFPRDTGFLLLVDLAGSTEYKTRQPNSLWLRRLQAFYDTIRDTVAPAKITKYLGDAVLIYIPASETSADQVLRMVTSILGGLETCNSEQEFVADHRIIVRIILNYGDAYLLLEHDPQGTAVDKVFRFEKFVPDGAIGATKQFRDMCNNGQFTLLGHYWLKGLYDEEGRHPLYIVNPDAPAVKEQMEIALSLSLATDLWWLPHGSSDKLNVVGGYIPPQDDSNATVQMGDRDALMHALVSLAKYGDIEKVDWHTSWSIPEALYRENLVCIGGPYYNTLTRLLMHDLPIEFSGLDDDESDETPLLAQLGEADRLTFRRKIGEDGRLKKDVGLFARFKNPMNPQSTVIIACGIESPAVDGTVRLFLHTSPTFQSLCKYLIAKLPGPPEHIGDAFFACVIKFDVESQSQRALLPRIDDSCLTVIPLG